MSNNLKLLISLYEEEKTQLQKLIDGNLVESDYLMAHYNSLALGQINERLQILNNIEDKLHDKKGFWQDEIDRLQEGAENENTGYLKEHYVKAFQKATDKLEKLNHVPKLTATTDGATLLDETLEKLLEKKISNLKVILKRDENLFLRISYSKNKLKVTLPYVKQLTKIWILHNGIINSFKILGFDLVENENKLTLTLAGSKEEILNRLKMVLSKIVFEIFYFKKFDNESYIQFTEKASR